MVFGVDTFGQFGNPARVSFLVIGALVQIEVGAVGPFIALARGYFFSCRGKNDPILQGMPHQNLNKAN